MILFKFIQTAHVCMIWNCFMNSTQVSATALKCVMWDSVLLQTGRRIFWDKVSLWVWFSWKLRRLMLSEVPQRIAPSLQLSEEKDVHFHNAMLYLSDTRGGLKFHLKWHYTPLFQHRWLKSLVPNALLLKLP